VYTIQEEASDQADEIGNKLVRVSSTSLAVYFTFHCCVQKKLRLKQQLESQREERDKRWLEERVGEVDRELEDCCDKAQTHANEIEKIEMVLEPLEFTKNEKDGEST
jgi:hypothetical protein